MNQNFLQRIDWFNHDGVNLPMINDFMRNQFYDRILRNTVKDQDCVDIGFGTGFLSMLALKHGARHVLAFESDTDRFLLGQTIIEQLNLQHQIQLVNERYDRSHQTSRIVFTETVNGNLWWEGLWNSLPETSAVFLPGEYFCEIWAVEVSRSFAQGLGRETSGARPFSPGVDVDQKFIDVVNQLRNVTTDRNTNLEPGLVKFPRQQETDWGWIPYLRAVQAGSVVGQYSVSRWQPDVEHFEIKIDTTTWKDQITLLVPRMGMAHGHHRLYLDTGHWGPAEDPILVVHPEYNVVVKHNVKSGAIEYTME